MKPAILVNLSRCTGCWTCSMACKVAHGLETEEWWQVVRTIGSGAGIDEPGGIYPHNYMEWMPVYTKKCTLCGDRIGEGLVPHCVWNCPTQALIFGDTDDPDSEISQAKAGFAAKGAQIFSLPTWEQSKKEVFYVK